MPEYWRFDPSGGRHHDAPLAGDRLINGAYQPVQIRQTGEAHLWGHSDVLNLDFCWEEGRLRWWDPAARIYLRTFDETEEERAAESEARARAEAQRDTEREAHMIAEARIRELEAELSQRDRES